MSYNHITGQIKSRVDGLNLFYQGWVAEKSLLSKSIIIQHGVGEHSGRYMNVVRAFENTGYSFFMLDARGHGKSEGKRGWLVSFDEYVQDLDTFVDFITKKYNLLKPVLLGHSMGAGIAVAYCLDPVRSAKLRGLVANASPFAVNLTFGMRVKLALAKFISLFFPHIALPSGLKPKNISRDLEVVKAYKNDPLNSGVMSYGLAREILNSSKASLENASKLNLPVLFTHGSADNISDCKGSQKIYEAAGNPDKPIHKTIKIYDGFYHEIYNDTGKEEPLGDLRKWVLENR
ncbi:MAG: lysophospholipase [Leptospirales bacterium]